LKQGVSIEEAMYWRVNKERPGLTVSGYKKGGSRKSVSSKVTPGEKGNVRRSETKEQHTHSKGERGKQNHETVRLRSVCGQLASWAAGLTADSN